MDRLAELKSGAARDPPRSSNATEITIDITGEGVDKGSFITTNYNSDVASSSTLKESLVTNPMIKDNVHSSSRAINMTEYNEYNNNAEMPSGLRTFLNDTESVQGNIAQIKKHTQDIENITQEIKTSTSTQEDEKKSAEIQDLIGKTNKTALLTKKLLKALTDQTEQLKSQGTIQGAEVRIRQTMVNTILRKFQAVVTKYQHIQEIYKRDVKSKLTRQIKIAKPDITDEQVVALMYSGGASDFMSSAIMKGADSAADQIKDSLRSATDKYAEVLKLEKSMAELHSMFQDFSLLVENQAELLDNIQHQVETAAEFIEQGNTELVMALDHLKDLRKKQFCLCMTTLVIIAIIIILVHFLSAKKKALKT